MTNNLSTLTLTKKFHALGTNISLSVFGQTDTSVLDASEQLVNRYEDLLTVNRPQSQMMDVNHQAGLAPVPVTSSVYQLAKLAILTSRQNFGFNAAIGPLVKLWHIGFDDASVPNDTDIKAKLQLIDPYKIHLDDQKQTIFLTQKGMELDLGAIAKGYIADRIQDLWKAYDVQAGIINLGGNLLMVGNPPHHQDQKWRIGLRNPFGDDENPIAIITVKACSAVTSGIYERHLETQGHSFHHILDPKTGYPHENNLAAVTVFTQKSVTAEIETTRLFFADHPLPNYPNQEDILGAVFITKDRKLLLSGLAPTQIAIINPAFQLQNSF